MASLRKLCRASLALACSAAAADLPIQHVVLYKNGIALFEHAGTVPAGEQARLGFRTSEMNDILESLTITDTAGHRMTSVRYDSNESLDQRLRNFPFTICAGELLSQILDGFKGAAVDLNLGGQKITGTTLGTRAAHRRPQETSRANPPGPPPS